MIMFVRIFCIRDNNLHNFDLESISYTIFIIIIILITNHVSQVLKSV